MGKTIHETNWKNKT